MMRKTMHTLSALTIAAALTIFATACSNEDFLQEGQQQQAVQTPSYSISIPASIGDDAMRSVSYDSGTGVLSSSFKTTDNIVVYNATKDAWALSDATVGAHQFQCLHPDANGTTANLTGANLTFYHHTHQKGEYDENIYDEYNTLIKVIHHDEVPESFTPVTAEVGDELILYYNTDNAQFNYQSQTGSVENLNNCDYATANGVEITAISGTSITTSNASFKNTQSMYKFTFTGLVGDAGVESVTFTSDHFFQTRDFDEDSQGTGGITITLTDEARAANGKGVVFAALSYNNSSFNDYDTEDIKIFVVDTNGKSYTAKKTTPMGGLKNGKFYTSTIALTPSISSTVNLASITENISLADGATLTGELDVINYPVKISIDKGATITLNNVTINGRSSSDYGWAGLTCLGDATIILNGVNTLKGFYEDYPGISVPFGSTLTIQGTGTLNASSNGYGAGIGGGYFKDCGNIVIQGGTITAIGGSQTAAIGGGYNSQCGTITIANTVTSVTAKLWDNWCFPLGYGYGGTCGVIKFGSYTAFDGTSWDPFPMVSGSYGGLQLTISDDAFEGDTWTFTPVAP